METDQRAKSAKETTDSVPKEPLNAAGLNGNVVSFTVVTHTVCSLPHPNDCVDTASDEREEEDSDESGALLAVFFTYKVDVLNKFDPEAFDNVMNFVKAINNGQIPQ